MDNALYFKNKIIDELCEKFHIVHHSSSIYYPQGNGQAEATNKTIINILKRIINDIGIYSWTPPFEPTRRVLENL